MTGTHPLSGNDKVIELLKKVHHYYPAGLPALYKTYPGFQELEEKIRDKFSESVNPGNMPYKALWEKLKESFPANAVHLHFYQFPNYFFEIELTQSENDGIEKRRSVIVVISLLVNYFTIYLADVIRLLDMDLLNSAGGKPRYEVFYRESAKGKKQGDYIEGIKDMVTHFFSGHEFIHHKLLFDLKVEGCTIYSDMEDYGNAEKHSIYELLFDGRRTFNTIVLD